MQNKLFLLFLILVTISCSGEKLPLIGGMTHNEKDELVQHYIKPFSFINQDNEEVTEDYLKGKITVVDFFFSTCPSICPIMTSNMHKVQQKWINNPTIQFLSHTVDPETDTYNKLKRYSSRYEIDTKNWNFVTGDKNKIYEAGVKSYLVSTSEDVLAPGGFLHSELFILVDGELHIRGIYDGTEEEDIKQLNKDLEILINE